MVVVECLVARGKDPLCDLGAAVDIVRAVHEDLRLDDGDEAVLLADDGIASEAVRVGVDGELGWLVGSDCKNGSPFREAGAGFVVFGAALAEIVMTLSGGLAVGAGELNGSFINLDAGENAAFGKNFNEGFAFSGFLVEGFFEEDDAAKILEGSWGTEEELAQAAAVFLYVLNVDAGKTFSDGASRLVGGEDAFARCSDVGGVLDQFICTKILTNYISRTLNRRKQADLLSWKLGN